MDAKHVLVAGPSGGGKSTNLRELHARHDGASIFLTTKSNERTAHNYPPERIRRSSARYPGDIEQSRQWAISRSETVQVIVDECQNAPSFRSGDGPLADGLHEDRSRGVKYVIATQNPMDLRTSESGYGPIQQAEYWVFVGKTKDWHVGFFNANNMADMIDHLPESNFEYVVIEPTASLSGREKVVYRGQTEAKYG